MNRPLISRILVISFILGMLLSCAAFFAAENGKPAEQSKSFLSSLAAWIKPVKKAKKLTKDEQAKLNEQLFLALNSDEINAKNLAKVKELLKAGANHYEICNMYKQRCNPLDLAMSKGLSYLTAFIDHQRASDPSKLSNYVNKQGYITECPLLLVYQTQILRVGRGKQIPPENELCAMIRLLLDAGADPNCKISAHLVKIHDSLTPLICLLTDQHGVASLHAPCANSMIEAILKHPKTNINQPDYNCDLDYDIKDLSERYASRVMHNKTPLMHVVEKVYKFKERQFRQQPTEADAKQTAAQQKKNPFVPRIELLLRYGADPALKDHQNKTALDYLPEQTASTRHIRELLKGKMHHPVIAQATGLHSNLVKIITGYVTGFDVFEEVGPKKD